MGMETLNFFDLLAKETMELGQVVEGRNPFYDEDFKASAEELVEQGQLNFDYQEELGEQNSHDFERCQDEQGDQIDQELSELEKDYDDGDTDDLEVIIPRQTQEFEEEKEQDVKEPFFENENDQNYIEQQTEPTLSNIVPGLIYRIDQGQNTFCLRAIVSKNIEGDFARISRPEELDDEELENVLGHLRIQDLNDFQSVFCYQTENLEMAEIIFDTLANRRFPYHEDMLCNLSDPGLSWWMNIGQDNFQIHFKSYGIERAEKLIRLGPVGDPQMAYKYFSQFYSILSELFPISEWVCSEKMISIATPKANTCFSELRDIFWQGKAPNFIPPELIKADKRSVILYFKELATIRSFWMQLQKKLKMAGAY